MIDDRLTTNIGNHCRILFAREFGSKSSDVKGVGVPVVCKAFNIPCPIQHRLCEELVDAGIVSWVKVTGEDEGRILWGIIIFYHPQSDNHGKNND